MIRIIFLEIKWVMRPYHINSILIPFSLGTLPCQQNIIYRIFNAMINRQAQVGFIFSTLFFIFPLYVLPIPPNIPHYIITDEIVHVLINPHDVTSSLQIYKQSTVKSTTMERDLYKHLPDGCHQLKEVHIPDCIELLVEGFSHKN